MRSCSYNEGLGKCSYITQSNVPGRGYSHQNVILKLKPTMKPTPFLLSMQSILSHLWSVSTSLDLGWGGEERTSIISNNGVNMINYENTQLIIIL